MRTVKTTSGATAVQVVWSSRRGSRKIEHFGSAHGEAELEALKTAAQQRIAAGQPELDLGLEPAGGGPLPIISSKMSHLVDSLERAYRVLGFEDAAGGDEVFRHLVLARIIEPSSKLDSLRVLEEAGVTPASVASTLVWLVLGYAFYSWVYAAAGSTADRQEQAQSLLLPLALPVIFGYVMATSTITSGHPSVLFHVLAYLPPTAPFAMPVLVSLGAASAWQFALSAAISVACTAGLAKGAIAVYRRSVLQAGRRVSLRELTAR